uniref:Uncharacterized protein n=1 Tax=Tetranychus urticae TaxID=32264 RepID=T1JSL9_TETUR
MRMVELKSSLDNYLRLHCFGLHCLY